MPIDQQRLDDLQNDFKTKKSMSMGIYVIMALNMNEQTSERRK